MRPLLFLGALLQRARCAFARWLLEGVRLQGQRFGDNTITLAPAGVSVIEWSAAQAPSAILQVGMAASGRPTGFIGGVVQAMLTTAEACAHYFWSSGTTSINNSVAATFVAFGDNTTTEADAEFIAPRAGFLRNLRARCNVNTFTNNTVISVRINGATSILTVTIATGSTVVVADTVNAPAVAAGDRIALIVNTSASGGGAGKVGAGCEFTIA